MGLFLPESEAKRRREEFARELDARLVYDDPVAQTFTRYLQNVDPRLMMARARELIAVGTPLIPGYYHVLRVNDGAPMSVFPVTGEHGEFVEPTFRVFDRLNAGNLHNPEVFKRISEEPERQRRAAEREKVADTQERQAELVERVHAVRRTQVSMDRGTPWSQNSQGRKRRG